MSQGLDLLIDQSSPLLEAAYALAQTASKDTASELANARGRAGPLAGSLALLTPLPCLCCAAVAALAVLRQSVCGTALPTHVMALTIETQAHASHATM